ncbi:hypothetical protein [Bradyrhizobium sp. CCGUVB23]|uniref:hypothetical protein n=1 Tax=Bradyrhizobium sp. CCGUVB23 TaxID=2949630 RepID=UPI0020B4270E|nr:hypothetical protein [Bradyrhizobium sp. CCGUVB23]MCP3463036.1 hypothetical protein [Bradyrhizobium sp. CCGUVB23]
MSSKSDAARNAVAAAAGLDGLLRPKPVQPAAAQPDNVVEINPETAAPRVEPAPSEHRKAAKPQEGTVRATYKRVMLYLPPKAKKKMQEIAFITDRKPHDIYLDALREFLERSGHPGLL